jgi:hypothetical protein
MNSKSIEKKIKEFIISSINLNFTEGIMLQELIISKIAMLPDYYQQEVLDFSDFLFSKINQTEHLVNHSRGGFGSRKGDYIMSNDFDEPLEDFKEYI